MDGELVILAVADHCKENMADLLEAIVTTSVPHDNKITSGINAKLMSDYEDALPVYQPANSHPLTVLPLTE